MKKAEDWIKDKYCNPIWTEWQSGDVLDAIEEYSIEALTEDRQQIKDMIDEMIKIEEKARDEFDKEESSWAFIEGRIFILKQLRSRL